MLLRQIEQIQDCVFLRRGVKCKTDLRLDYTYEVHIQHMFLL